MRQRRLIMVTILLILVEPAVVLSLTHRFPNRVEGQQPQQMSPGLAQEGSFKNSAAD